VDVIAFAVELPQLRAEALTHVPHDRLTARQHLLVEDLTPVLRDEHQMGVEVENDMISPSNIGIWFPASVTYAKGRKIK
jgi:hypothetical protein